MHRNHLTVMHLERPTFAGSSERPKVSNRPLPEATTLCSVMCGSAERTLSCSKTILCEVSHRGNPRVTKRIYAVLDDMSDSSYIAEKLIEELQLTGREESYLLNTLGSCRSEQKGLVVQGLWIRGISKDKYYELPELFSSPFIPGSEYEVATPRIVKNLPHISGWADGFSEIDRGAEPLVLIGRDAGDLMWSRCYGEHAPFVCETRLGFALIGSPCIDSSKPTLRIKSTFKTVHEHYSSKILFPKIKCSQPDDIFQESRDDDELAPSREEVKFRTIVEDSIHVNDKVEFQLAFLSKGHSSDA